MPAPWNTDPALLTATNSGQSNFIVETLNTDNTTGEGIVNEIGAFSGVLPFDFTQGQSVSRLKVTSDGNWSLTFASVSTAPQFNGGFTGKGDTVLLYTGPAATMHITHSGTANFIVDAYPVDGGNQSNVVNEIGAYNGTQPIQAGPILIGITADGSFTFAPT